MTVNDLLVLEEEQLHLSPTAIVQPGYITVRQLTKEFRDAEGQQITVLNGIDFEIAEGEFVAVFGPNGCGKTTLLRILAGLDDEWTGEVIVGGHAPALVECGFVFQDFQPTRKRINFPVMALSSIASIFLMTKNYLKNKKNNS